MLIGVVLNYFLPASVFEIITSVSAFACMVTWIMIICCQLSFRKKLGPEGYKTVRYKMPFAPYSNYFTIAFFAIVLISALFHPNTRIGIISTVIWLVILVAMYYIVGFNKKEEKIEFERYEGDGK